MGSPVQNGDPRADGQAKFDSRRVERREHGKNPVTVIEKENGGFSFPQKQMAAIGRCVMPLLPDPTNEDVAVVLVGALNPAIFQPAWITAQKLISEGEASEARVNIISPQAADITFLDFGLQVLQNRLTIRTIDISKTAKISDLIVGLLTKLPHTPITAAGINHSLHVSVGSEKVWNKIGHILVPKSPVWESLYEKPGMLSVAIQSVRSGENPLQINVTIQPSQLAPYGVYVASNFDFKVGNEVGSAFEVIEFIRTNWNEATQEARRVAETIFEKIVWHQS